MSGIKRHLGRQFLCETARTDLLTYCEMIHSVAEPSETFRAYYHTRVLATAVQNAIEGDIKRLLIAVPPRFGKSLVGSIAAPAWALGRDPALRVICTSYGDELSRDFAVKSRLIMQSEAHRRIFPQCSLAASGTAHHRLSTTKGGYRLATSVGGSVTGKGANIIIVDDPLKAKDAVYSQAARDEAFNYITGTLMSRFDEPAKGRMIVISQRLHTDDLIARLRDEGDWTLLAIPAEAQVPMLLDRGGGEQWQLAPGDLLFPERFDHKVLDQLKHDLGEANYAAQILQDPRALGGTIFKTKHFQSMPCSDFYRDKMECIIQSWDTAISEEETAAWSVCTTWGVYGKFFALMDVYREKLSYPALLKAVHCQYEKHKPAGVIVEYASSGQALYQQLCQEGCTWIYKVKPVGSKQERAMHQAPKIEQGRVLLPAKAPWYATFINEIASFPLGRSDQVDSMTQFLRAFDTGRNHALFRELRYWQNQAA